MKRFRPRTLGESVGEAPARVLTPAPLPAADIQSVSSTQLALTQGHSWLTADFTTTNTTDWQTVHTIDIDIPSTTNYAFYFWVTAYAKHSAGGDIHFRVQLALDDTLLSSYVIQRTPRLTVAANTPTNVSMGVGMDGYSNLPGVKPGSRRLYFVARNYTAGTLTVHGDTTDAVVLPAIFALVSGKKA